MFLQSRHGQNIEDLFWLNISASAADMNDLTPDKYSSHVHLSRYIHFRYSIYNNTKMEYVRINHASKYTPKRDANSFEWKKIWQFKIHPNLTYTIQKCSDHSHKVPGSTRSRNGVEGRHFIKLWYEGVYLYVTINYYVKRDPDSSGSIYNNDQQ